MRKLKQEWDKLSVKKNLTGAEALKAVKQDGDALQYVSVQTPEICLEAVKQDGYALRHVSSEMFGQENEFTIEQLEELTGIMNLKIKK